MAPSSPLGHKPNWIPITYSLVENLLKKDVLPSMPLGTQQGGTDIYSMRLRLFLTLAWPIKI